MSTKLIAILAVVVVFGMSPIVAADKTKDACKTGTATPPAKVSAARGTDRGKTWHRKDGKVSTPMQSAPSSSVRSLPYQMPTSRPAFAYSSVGRDSNYDYFADRYGYSDRTPPRAASSQPANVLGYVPPSDNSQNPFIYRRPTQ